MGATVRQHASRGWVVTTHHKGNRKQKSFGKGPDSEERARAFATAIELEMRAADSWLDDLVPRTDEACRGWLATYRATLTRSFEATATSSIETHLAPWFGSRPLASIDEATLIKFIENVFEKGLSGHTAATALSILRRVCSLHVEANVLTKNPVAKFGPLVSDVASRYAEEVREIETWTPEEALELLDLARQHEPHVAPVLLAAFHTGMRRGELLGLQWRDVKRREIVIRRALVANRLKVPKSGKKREVPISAELRETLAELREAVKVRRAFQDAGPVFLSPTGEVWDVSNFGRAWRRLEKHCIAADVPFLRFHDCRHSFATWALEGGRSIKWVQLALGHSSPELTLRTYAHVVPRDEDSLEFLPSSAGRGPNADKRGQDSAKAKRLRRK